MKLKYNISVLLIASILLSSCAYLFSELVSIIVWQLIVRNNTNPVRLDPAGGFSYKPYSVNKLPGYPGVLYSDRYGFIHNGNVSRLIKPGDLFIFG